MNALMTKLQQPISVVALAHCLGFGAHKKARSAALRRSRRPGRGRTRSAADAMPVLPTLDGDDEATHPGCGWFDSSHELHRGLVVLEHRGAEGLGAELPVTVWLQLVLDGAAATQGMIQS